MYVVCWDVYARCLDDVFVHLLFVYVSSPEQPQKDAETPLVSALN
jgi:hypothetical protein